ncbi:MAG: hypothetical protein AAF830_16275 [Pseudomonadota bacterium]
MSRFLVFFACPDCAASPVVRGETEAAGIACPVCARHFGMVSEMRKVGLVISRATGS